MSFMDFFASKTVALAMTLVPILSRCFDLKNTDDWVYDRLPAKWKQNGTLQEFNQVFASGKTFLQACWEFTHK